MKHRVLNHPALMMALFTFCWAVVEPLGAYAGVSAYQVVWTRYGVHLAFMALVFGPRHGLRLVRSVRPARQVVRSLMMLGMPLCFIWAMQRVPPQDALAVFWIAPLLVIAIAAVTSGKYGGVRTLLATGVGLLGAMLICKPGAGILHPGALLALGMAVCFTVYVVMTREMHDETLLAKLFHTALWVFLSLTLMLPLFWHTPTVRGMMAMTGIGLLGWVGLYALDRAVDSMPPALLAPVLYTQLAWEVLLRRPLHISAPDVKALAGTVLILAATVPALMWRSSHPASLSVTAD